MAHASAANTTVAESQDFVNCSDVGSATGVFLCTVNSDLNNVFKPMLTSTPMFVAGFLFMVQYHWLPFCGISRSETLRIFGQGVIVLQFYFDEKFHCKNPFVVSCLYIFLDRVVMLKVMEVLACMCPFCGRRRQLIIEGELPIGSNAEHIMLVKNKYMDPSYSFRGILLTFVAQISLMCYFIFYINADSASHDIHNVSFWKWLVAVIITIVVDEDEAGIAFDDSYWKRFRAHPTARRMRLKRHRIFWCFTVSYKADWKIRKFLDIIINAICRTIVLSVAPILLSTEDPMDFIKDCLAMFFISKLDDFDDAKNFEEALADCLKRYDRGKEMTAELKDLYAAVSENDDV